MKRIVRRWVIRLIPLAAGCAADTPVEWPAVISADSPVEFPVELWDRGVEGETLLLIRVDDLGAADSVAVARSSGQAAFDSAAVAGARELRFRPGRRGDRRVSMWVRLPVRFTREGGAVVGDTEGTSR